MEETSLWVALGLLAVGILGVVLVLYGWEDSIE